VGDFVFGIRHQCSACRGIFFDLKNLPTLLDNATQYGLLENHGLALRSICPGCHAPRKVTDSRYCASCITDCGFRCPRCGMGMHRITIHKLEIEQCPCCRGSFYDPGEIDLLCRSVTPEEMSGELICKACGRQGLTHRNTILVADGVLCDPCGMRHEFKENIAFKAAMGDEYEFDDNGNAIEATGGSMAEFLAEYAPIGRLFSRKARTLEQEKFIWEVIFIVLRLLGRCR